MPTTASKAPAALLLLLALLCRASLSAAAPAPRGTLSDTLRLRLDSVFAANPLTRTSMAALCVYDLSADTALYERNGRQTMRPASAMKILTAVTALDRLGPEYTLRTRLLHTGGVACGVSDSARTLRGDLYCVGAMDPLLGPDDLRALARSVKQLADTVRGALLADRSMKDPAPYGAGWCWDDDNPNLSPALCDRRPDLQARLAEALADEGVVVAGSADSAAVCPPGAAPIAERSHTVAQLLAPMMKRSDNLIAESLFAHLALLKGRPATATAAAAVIEETLRKAAPPLADAPHRFADGSGLSLYNYLSAETLAAFLRYAYASPGIYAALLPTLPRAGVDGTLSGRMTLSAARDNVRAKTGTLYGVAALAGYCTAPDGRPLAFAVINNGALAAADARRFQDALCDALCRR